MHLASTMRRRPRRREVLAGVLVVALVVASMNFVVGGRWFAAERPAAAPREVESVVLGRRAWFARWEWREGLVGRWVWPWVAHSAVVPASRWSEPAWAQKHENLTLLARTMGPSIRVMFLGDSITNHWAWKAPDVWDKEFAPLGAQNFGVSGDRTQHVLWRLRNGESENLKPDAVVLLIGTNNVPRAADARNSPREIVEGIVAVVEELCSRFGAAKVLVLAVFPRGKPDSLQRRVVAHVNADLPSALGELVSGSADASSPCVRRDVRFVDVGHVFLDAEGSVDASMPDLLHPAPAYYARLASVLRGPVRRLLGLSDSI